MPLGDPSGGGGKSGGILGALKTGGSALINALKAPQQVAFRVGAGLGDLTQGDYTGALDSAKHAVGEAATLGQMHGDINFAQAAGTYDKATGTRTPAKLPTGVATAADLALDPTLFTGIGKGAEAREGVSALSKILEVSPQEVSAGIKDGTYDLSKGSDLRQALVDHVAKDSLANGAKAQKLADAGKIDEAVAGATKSAEKTAMLTARRGAGGLNVFVPGTDLSKNLISGGAIGNAGEAIGNVAKMIPGVSTAADMAGKAFNTTHDLTQAFGQDLGAKIHDLGTARQAKMATDKDNLVGELTNAVHTVGRPFTPEDNSDLLGAIERGPQGFQDLLAKKPELSTMADAVQRIGDRTTQEQVVRGLLGTSPANMDQLTENAANLSGKAADSRASLQDAMSRSKTAYDNAQRARAVAEQNLSKAGPGSKANALGLAKKARAAEDTAAAAAAKNKADFEAFAKESIAANETRPNIIPAISSKPEAMAGVRDETSKPWSADLKAPAAWEPVPEPGTVGHQVIDLGDGIEHHIFNKADAEGNITGRFSYIKHPDGNLEGLNISVDPALRRQGIATSLYDAAKAEGHDVEASSGKGQSFLPDGAEYAAGRRTKAASDVIDHTDPKLEALAKTAREKADAAAAARADSEAAAKGIKKLSNGAGKEAQKASREAGRLQVKTQQLEAAAKKAQAALEEASAGNRGIRENYAQRLLTPEAQDLGEGKTVGHASSVAGSVSGALRQSAEKARSVFPNMPSDMVNELIDSAQKGQDIRVILHDPAYAKYVPKEPDVLEHMTQALEGYAKELPEGSKLYEQNALASLLNRGVSASGAINAHDYIGDLKGLTTTVDGVDHPLVMDANEVADATAEGGKGIPEGWVTKNLPHIGNIAAPKELIPEIEGVTGAAAKDDFINTFQQGMQKWAQFWRAHATTGVLGALPFAARNGRSNMYLMHADGYSFKEILKSMQDAKSLEDKVRDIAGSTRLTGKFIGQHAEEVAKGGLDEALKAHLTGHEYDMYKAMQDHGILTQGFFPTDFADTAKDTVRKLTGQKDDGNKVLKAVKDVVGAHGAVATKGRDLNQAIETNARMAHFMLGTDRYGSVEKAALRTKAILFNYGDLTPFEKRVLKNVVPFYTFMRKNLPLQLTTMVENPTRLAVPEKIAQSMTQALPTGAPDYQETGGSRIVNSALPLIGGLVTTPDRPIYAASGPFDPLLSALHGQGKAAARGVVNNFSGPQLSLLQNLTEIGTGKDAYTGANVKPGAVANIQRLVGGQVPSIGRLPARLGPVTDQALTGKNSTTSKMTATELLKLLTGLRLDKQQAAK